MNSTIKRRISGPALTLSLVLSQAAAPTQALAEESAGADLLLPKPAEYIPALIAFLIIWFVLAKLAWPSIVSTLEKRQEKIQGDLDAAEAARKQAKQDAKKYTERLEQAHREAEEIIAQAKKDAEAERSRILAKAQTESAEIISKAHSAVGSERKKAMIELSGQVVDLSVEIASKIIGESLSTEDQRRLAEKYLAEVSVSDVK